MKITDICESTTAGSIATVSAPMNGGPLKRSSVGKGVYGKEPAGSLFTGKKTSKPFANSKLNEEGGFTGERVTVIYIDDKPVLKFSDDDQADKALNLLRKKHPELKVKFKQEVIKEAVMPSPVAKHKQKLAGMSDAELAERLKDKSDDELKKMAERHGYGKMSPHYVNRIKKVTESTDTSKYKVQIICDDGGETSYTVYAKTKEEAWRKATKFANDDGYEDFQAKIITEPSKKPVQEAQLDEEDLILVPGQGHRLKSGFIPHAEDRRDHEVEMARSDLHQAHKNSSKIHKLIKNVSEDEGLEGWVQAKITKAADYLNSVRQYLEGKQLQEMTGGVIAGGGVGEGLSEGKQETYNLRDLGNDLNNYVGSDSESVLVTKILNILRNNYTDSRGASLPNREISGSELMSLYGISARQQGAFINFIDKVYGGPKKDEEDSYNSFRFDEEADLLDEGMDVKKLAAIAAAFGFNLVPNNVGDGTSGRSPADRAYNTYLSQTPSHLVPRYTTPTKGK